MACEPCAEVAEVVWGPDNGLPSNMGGILVSAEPDYHEPITLNGEVWTKVQRSLFAGAWESAASAVGLYLTPPPSVERDWDLSIFPLGTAGFRWVYLDTGYHRKLGATSWYDWDHCMAPSYAGFGFGAIQSVAAMGYRPFAVYEVVGIDVVFGRRADGSTYTCGYKLRVRVWAGISNHFSFFLSPDSLPDAEEPYGTHDLPAAMCLEAVREDRSKVDERGTLAEWFVRLVNLQTYTMRWQRDGETARDTWATYTCNADQFRPPSDFNAYADGDGDPTGLAFSNPNAEEETEEEREAEDDFSAFFGHVTTGEVCVYQSYEDVDFDRAGRDAFEALFGSRIQLTARLEWYGPDTVEDSPPQDVELSFTLKSSAVQSVSAEKAFIDGLRNTPGGRWVFRNTDVENLERAVDVAERRAQASGPCGCVEG